MNPKVKEDLMSYTLAAKAIIYDAKRMESFLPMIETRNGAIQAVQSVMAVIDMKKPIPPSVAPFLGVNIYVLMVQMAQDITGRKADKAIMQKVIFDILGNVLKSHGKPTKQPAAPMAQPEAQPQPPAAQPAPQPGLIGA